MLRFGMECNDIQFAFVTTFGPFSDKNIATDEIPFVFIPLGDKFL